MAPNRETSWWASMSWIEYAGRVRSATGTPLPSVCFLVGERAASPPRIKPMMRFALLCGALAAVATVPRSSAAQAAAPAVVPAHVGVLVHRLPVDSTRLQPGHLVYRAVLVRDTATTVIGDQEFVISALDYAGTPAWMLARQGQQGVSPTTDSLVVRRSDLRPLHWASSLGPARLAAEFTPDTVFGAMTSPLGKQTLILPNRPDLLVNTMGV